MIPSIRQKREEFSGKQRAVSPVIGVILMVAITVILAAVIGFFVLGIGSDQQSAPQASFDFQNTGTGIKITHAGGDSLDASKTKVLAGGSPTLTQFSGTITAGKSITVTAASGAEIRIVYTMDNGQTSTLASYTVP